jgi:hypothetical protein
MRKKALLVAARAGAIGPAVVLDGGEWEVEEIPSVKLRWEGEWERIGNIVRLKGRAKIFAEVLADAVGDVHLDIKQVA